jgi:cell filamentation protein
MKKGSAVQYVASGVNEFEPGSGGKVLKNLLEITSARKMHETEFSGYLTAERRVMTEFTKGQWITLDDLHRIHKGFLGGIYSWAGTIRSVNISKGGFTFATTYALRAALKEFADHVLPAHTPPRGDSLKEIAEHIATVQCEFLLLHPYREGNGRTARLVATLMAYQAGLPGIDFSFIGGRGKEFRKYVAGIQKGVGKNYTLMTEIVLRALRRALRRAGASSIS